MSFIAYLNQDLLPPSDFFDILFFHFNLGLSNFYTSNMSRHPKENFTAKELEDCQTSPISSYLGSSRASRQSSPQTSANPDTRAPGLQSPQRFVSAAERAGKPTRPTSPASAGGRQPPNWAPGGAGMQLPRLPGLQPGGGFTPRPQLPNFAPFRAGMQLASLPAPTGWRLRTTSPAPRLSLQPSSRGATPQPPCRWSCFAEAGLTTFGRSFLAPSPSRPSLRPAMR